MISQIRELISLNREMISLIREMISLIRQFGIFDRLGFPYVNNEKRTSDNYKKYPLLNEP